MDIQKILTEAKQKYPVNTVFLSAYSGNEKIVCGDLHTDHLSSGIIDDRGNFIYHEGKWAEIINQKQLPIFN